jgi:hypothetical protein
MVFLGKRLDQLTEADLQQLVDRAAPELRVLEFKAELNDQGKEARKELLADISSFANASGGYLLFGIAEKSGTAAELIGIQIDDVDRHRNAIESLVRDCIQPRLPSFHSAYVRLGNGKLVVVLQVDQSWTGPHLVRLGESSRFYGRYSGGKCLLDVHQIRAAFLGSASTSKRIAEFRADRVAKVLANEGSKDLIYGPKLIVHLLPLRSFYPGASVDFSAVRELTVLGSNSTVPPNMNLDGAVAYFRHPRGEEGPHAGYTQLFRNGCVEAVCGDDPALGWNSAGREFKEVLSPTGLEVRTLGFLWTQLRITTQLGIEPPVFVCISITDVVGFDARMPERMLPMLRETKRLRTNVLLVPEVEFEQLDNSNLPAKLRPAFDFLWQAFELPGSLNYQDASYTQWTAPRR